MKAAGFVAQESGLDRHAHVTACVAPLCKRSPETYGNCAHWGKRQHALRPSRTQSARTQRAQVELWVACGDTEWSAPSEACFFVGVRLECSHPFTAHTLRLQQRAGLRCWTGSQTVLPRDTVLCAVGHWPPPLACICELCTREWLPAISTPNCVEQPLIASLARV